MYWRFNTIQHFHFPFLISHPPINFVHVNLHAWPNCAFSPSLSHLQECNHSIVFACFSSLSRCPRLYLLSVQLCMSQKWSLQRNAIHVCHFHAWLYWFQVQIKSISWPCCKSMCSLNFELFDEPVSYWNLILTCLLGGYLFFPSNSPVEYRS